MWTHCVPVVALYSFSSYCCTHSQEKLKRHRHKLWHKLTIRDFHVNTLCTCAGSVQLQFIFLHSHGTNGKDKDTSWQSEISMPDLQLQFIILQRTNVCFFKTETQADLTHWQSKYKKCGCPFTKVWCTKQLGTHSSDSSGQLPALYQKHLQEKEEEIKMKQERMRKKKRRRRKKRRPRRREGRHRDKEEEKKGWEENDGTDEEEEEELEEDYNDWYTNVRGNHMRCRKHTVTFYSHDLPLCRSR